MRNSESDGTGETSGGRRRGRRTLSGASSTTSASSNSTETDSSSTASACVQSQSDILDIATRAWPCSTVVAVLGGILGITGLAGIAVAFLVFPGVWPVLAAAVAAMVIGAVVVIWHLIAGTHNDELRHRLFELQRTLGVPGEMPAGSLVAQGTWLAIEAATR